MIDLTQLYDLTPNEWNNMLEGHEYRMIDKKRFAVEEAYLFANANNGKKLTSYTRSLDMQEAKVGKTEEEVKKDKAYQKALHQKQSIDMSIWYQSLQKSQEEKEDKDE